MNNKAHNTQSTQEKVKCINESINHLVNCVKHLEHMRSYNYLSTITDEDLEKVMDYMEKLENSIEQLNAPKDNLSNSKTLIKAVGKDKKLWVSKPNNSKENTQATQQPNNNHFSRPEKILKNYFNNV